MEHVGKFRKTVLVGALVFAACAWTGCQNKTVSNVAVGQVAEGEAGEQLQKDYIINDKSLAKEIEVVDVKARHIGDNLEGQAVIRNLKKQTVPFEYKFEWYDADNSPIESNITLWTPDLLYGKETKWIKSTCPKPDAKGFKIMIREPNPVEEQ